jgi:hypothetical protein
LVAALPLWAICGSTVFVSVDRALLQYRQVLERGALNFAPGLDPGNVRATLRANSHASLDRVNIGFSFLFFCLHLSDTMPATNVVPLKPSDQEDFAKLESSTGFADEIRVS